METPAVGGFDHFHPGFSRKGIQATAIFLGHRGTANDRRVGLRHDQALAQLLRSVNQV